MNWAEKLMALPVGNQSVLWDEKGLNENKGKGKGYKGIKGMG